MVDGREPSPYHPGWVMGHGFPPGHIGFAVAVLCVCAAFIVVAFVVA